MSIKDDVFGLPESKNGVARVIVFICLMGLFILATVIFSTAHAEQPNSIPIADQRIDTAFVSHPYLFDNSFSLSQKINSELVSILDGVKIRIISGGILSTADFDEWSVQMGKANTVKYQQAFYAAFAGNNGPKSMTDIRVTSHDGSNSMNCVISHPNTDWHVTWALGGVNMSMDYADKDYNLNDVSEFVLYHESKHCVSNNDTVIINENLSDVFAALIYRVNHNGKTTMLDDIIGFRRYQIGNAALSDDHDFKQAAYDHDTRHTLQKVIDLDFESELLGLSIQDINKLANKIVSQHL